MVVFFYGLSWSCWAIDLRKDSCILKWGGPTEKSRVLSIFLFISGPRKVKDKSGINVKSRAMDCGLTPTLSLTLYVNVYWACRKKHKILPQQWREHKGRLWLFVCELCIGRKRNKNLNMASAVMSARPGGLPSRVQILNNIFLHKLKNPGVSSCYMLCSHHCWRYIYPFFF